MARNRENMFQAGLLNQMKEKDELILFLRNEINALHDEMDDRDSEAAKKYEGEIADLKQSLNEANEKLNEDAKVIAGLEQELSEYKKVKAAADIENFDFRSIIDLIQKRTYCQKSECTRYLNDEIDPNNPSAMDMDLGDLTQMIIDEFKCASRGTASGMLSDKEHKRPKSKHKPVAKNKTTEIGFSDKKYKYEATEINRILLTNMPENATLLRRKSTLSGYDKWIVRAWLYENPKVILREYEVARISIPGEGLSNIGHPKTIIKDNPIHPSFARFYLDSKFGLNLSENRILDTLKSMNTKIPQSSLNLWMHQIMELVRTRLESLMLEAIRRSGNAYNDETRILVRSRLNKSMPFKYNTEYIHACFSAEQKLMAMIYDNGSRSHAVQEEKFFKDSNIKTFMADRAPLYKTIVKDLAEYEIERAACWVHARRRFVDALSSDSRVETFIRAINTLFRIERESKEREHSPLRRQMHRQRFSKELVDWIFKRAKEMKLEGNEYGLLVHRALDYILDDEEAFRVFLKNGDIDISNNMVENMFRHIAMGRRNWLHTGSHYAAQNIAFMYSLYESCKLNDINFGKYIEDILTRFMNDEEADNTFLPNKWVARTPETGIQTA